jgi:hypothetical protein
MKVWESTAPCRCEERFDLGHHLRHVDFERVLGFEAFVRGEMDFSGGADARSARIGARMRF